MKTLIISFLLFFVQNIYAQKYYNEIFTFENSEIKYLSYDVSNKPANTFFVFINYKKNLEKCFTNKYMRHYFLDMPADIPKEKQDELFLEFVHDITSKAKLVESNFYLVSDKDYTSLYRDIFNKVLRYKGSYLNEIKSMYIDPTEAEICKILQQ